VARGTIAYQNNGWVHFQDGHPPANAEINPAVPCAKTSGVQDRRLNAARTGQSSHPAGGRGEPGKG
jgi:hypothetical protein